MLIASILLKISMIVFLFPPIRQFRGTFFFYFLILAIEDPISRFVIFNLGVYQGIVHLGFSIFLLMSIIKPEKFIRSLRFLIPAVLIICCGFVYLFSTYGWNFSKIRMGIGIAHVVIFIALAKKIIHFINQKFAINLFHILILIYEASVIAKFIVYSLYSSKGFLFFFITLAFEIMLGVLFSIYRDDNPKLIIKVN